MTGTTTMTSKNLTWKIGAIVAIKIVGALFATLVFARFSPLVDSKLYLSGYFAIDPLLRTQIVHRLAVALNGLGGAFFSHVVFGLISATGVIYYLVTGGRRWIFVVMLLLPSSFIWTSIVGKEALYFGCFTLLLVVWSKYAIEALNPADILVAVLALGICGLLRPHYAIVVAWLFFSTGVVKKLGGRSWWIILGALSLAGTAIYFFAWTDLLYRGFNAIEASARSSRFELFGLAEHDSNGYDRFKHYVPLGTIVGIVGPLPSELIKRPEFIPFFLEGLLILLSPALVYKYANTQDFKGKALFSRIYWWCFVPAVLSVMILHAPFGLLNPGSATRWRTNFESLFYMAPLLLLYRLKDYIRYEDSSLPS